MESIPEICLNVERVDTRFVVAIVLDKAREIQNGSVEGVDENVEVLLNSLKL